MGLDEKFSRSARFSFFLLFALCLFLSPLSCKGDRHAQAAGIKSFVSRTEGDAGKTSSTPGTLTKGEVPTIQLVPLGRIRQDHIDIVVRAVESTFVASVSLSPKTAMPKDAYVPSRRRWMANDLLDFLNRMKVPKALKVIGITDEDICTPTEKSPTWGIFGLGSLDGWSCVVSTWRLGGRANHPKLVERLSKVVVHEIGHTFNLEHCPVRGCIMEDARGTIVTVDREKAFCPACQKKLGPRLRTDSEFAKWAD